MAVDEVARRVKTALSVLDEIPRLPDVGTHGEGCYRHHKDCLAEHLTQILRGDV